MFSSFDRCPVLVTGAGGFSGSHLTERLLDLAFRIVLAPVRLIAGGPNFLVRHANLRIA